MTLLTARTDDGIELHCRVLGGGPRPPVLLIHAMMVDARTLDRPRGHGLASVLARDRQVFVADLRGRGGSRAPLRWTYEDLVYRDLPALVGAVVDHAGERPFLVGHSLGGHVGLASWASGSIEIAGLIGLGANAWLPDCEPDRTQRWRKRVALASLAGVATVAGRLPARALGIGPVDEAAPYARDLAAFWWRGWTDRSGHDWRADLRRLRGPALFVTSEGDRLLARPDGARGFVRPFVGAEHLRLRDGDFGLLAPDHMGLVTAPSSRPLWEHLATWLDRHG